MAESRESNASTPTSARSEDGDSELPKKPEATSSNDSKLECPVCLQACVHPVRLPCGHIFCFLCVKGVAFKNLRCAMCRCDIPLTYLDHPQLVNGFEEIVRAATATVPDGDEYRWYYEGGHGWWQYDERTSQELEEAYLRGEKSCKILVAGFVYIVSFEHKCQIRQNDYSRIRRIKRDLVTIPKKGVAGLRLEANDTTTPSAANDMNELSSAMGEMNLNEGASTSASTNSTRTNYASSTGDSDGTNNQLAENVHSTDSDDSSGPTNEEDEIPGTAEGPSSVDPATTTAHNVTDTAGPIMQELIDLNHQGYSATESEGEDRNVDENLLLL